eukprot:CFRG7112T1
MGRLYTSFRKGRAGKNCSSRAWALGFGWCVWLAVICFIISVARITGLFGLIIVIDLGINPFDLYLFDNGNVTRSDYHYLSDMFNRTDDALRDIKIPYSISAGSLLGLCRHGGPIPWDDDTDIIVPKEDFFTVIDHLNETLSPHGYVVMYQAPASKNMRKIKAKLFPVNGTPVKSRQCRLLGQDCYKYPFIDIFVYFEEKGQEGKTTLRMSDKEYTIVDSTLVRETVPVTYQWPGGFTSHVRAFNGAHGIVKKMYGELYMEVCISRGYNHKLNSLAEKYKTFSMPCSKVQVLKPHLPFSGGISMCANSLRSHV